MPAALASLPTEIHARIAGMCALQDRRFKDAKCAISAERFPLADPYQMPKYTTVGVLSVLSRYWNKVTEPYRFSRLKATHLTSRNYRLGFGRKFGRYITELDLSDLCADEEDKMDPTIVLDALPSLPNLHTVVTPNMEDVAEMVTRNTERNTKLNTLHTAAEVSFVTEALFELFAAVPSLVVNTGVLDHDFLDRLAEKSPQTRQLVLHNRENLDTVPVIVYAVDALHLFPQLTDLKLVISEEFTDYEDLHQFVLPSGCRLRHFSVSTWGGEVAPLFALVAKMSPVLHSLELNLEELYHDRADFAGFPTDSHFPHLETLVVTTTRAADLGHFVPSILPVAFPALRHLKLRSRSPAKPLQEETLTDLTAAFASRLHPLVISADVVCDNVSSLRLGDSQLPTMNLPGRNRRSLIPSDIFSDPMDQRRWATLSRARRISFVVDSRPALEPLLDRMRDMVHEALELEDWVQLMRIAHALQPCELLRVERDA